MLYELAGKLKDDHKLALYFLALRQYSCVRLAAMRGQTDRNIRKVRGTIRRKLQRQMYRELVKRKQKNLPITHFQRDFMRKYGLLGMMTALPTTPKFIEYEKVYLLKNRFIKAKTMDTEDYLSHFYPFEHPCFKKKGIESSWEIGDPTMAALFLTFQSRLQSQVMTFQRTYGERYGWRKLQCTDWALIAMTCFFDYEGRDNIDPVQRDVYRKALEGFDSTAPGSHCALTDERPVLVWDFHSLSLTPQMLLAFLLTDDKRPLRLCRNCMKPFISETFG